MKHTGTQLSARIMSPADAASTGFAGERARVRDHRIDVLRGAALLTIFFDHIPSNALASITLHNFALFDAAEVFVLLAGMSGALAYGRVIDRDGLWSGIRRIGNRCWQLYLAQVALFLVTLTVVQIASTYLGLKVVIFAPIMQEPVKGVMLGLILGAQPDYLNILPLYMAILAVFPAVWLVAKRSVVAALVGSGLVWLASGLVPGLNLPNWMTDEGWYFNPFAWQFLLTLGVVMTRLSRRNGGNLPWHPGLAIAAAMFLLLTLPQSAAWQALDLPVPWSVVLDASDKTGLAWPRIFGMVALAYLVFASRRTAAIAAFPVLKWLRDCGRHSLEVFAVGCVSALLGRVTFRVVEADLLWVQALVNVLGVAAMVATAWWMERGRQPASRSLPRRIGTRTCRDFVGQGEIACARNI